MAIGMGTLASGKCVCRFVGIVGMRVPGEWVQAVLPSAAASSGASSTARAHVVVAESFRKVAAQFSRGIRGLCRIAVAGLSATARFGSSGRGGGI